MIDSLSRLTFASLPHRCEQHLDFNGLWQVLVSRHAAVNCDCESGCVLGVNILIFIFVGAEPDKLLLLLF